MFDVDDRTFVNASFDSAANFLRQLFRRREFFGDFRIVFNLRYITSFHVNWGRLAFFSTATLESVPDGASVRLNGREIAGPLADRSRRAGRRG